MAPNPEASGVIPAPPTLEELMRKNPELSRTDLEYLQDWLSKQPHLPKLTDEQLVPFLHSNYYSLERAKSTIENYFTIRTHAPRIFQNMDPQDREVKKQFDLYVTSLLSKKDSRGYTILASTLCNYDSTDLDFEVILRSFLMLVDMYTRENPTCPGYVVILDNRGLTMGHIAKASISAIKVFITYVQDAIPSRIKAIHVVHCNSMMDTIMKLCKPFMHGELINMIHLHSGDMPDFYKEFPKDILPVEYEGELSSLSEMNILTMKKIMANRDWLLENQKLIVDESKRPGKAKSAGEVFGLEGSFKKLDID